MRYLLSGKAQIDLEEIYDFSFDKFGQFQADFYFEKLLDRLDQIAKFPEVGVRRADLNEKIRSLLSESHLIFYEVQEAHILIVRVLHHSRDIEKYL